jgi:predicted nuclease with TOPRIM domain
MLTTGYRWGTPSDELVSMSDMKHDAIVRSGIRTLQRVPIAVELIAANAEMQAKTATGCDTESAAVLVSEKLENITGRGLGA